MDRGNYTKRILIHYFSLLYQETFGSRMPADCHAELEDAIGLIFEAINDVDRRVDYIYERGESQK